MIRPEYRKFYGQEWRARRLILIAGAGNRCAICGREFPSSRLQGAHVFHDPRHPSVRVLCISDHSRVDAAHRTAVLRRRRARESGQLWLMPELEYASVPAWEIPLDALRTLYSQASLFECLEDRGISG